MRRTFAAQLDALAEIRPAVFTVHLGRCRRTRSGRSAQGLGGGATYRRGPTARSARLLRHGRGRGSGRAPWGLPCGTLTTHSPEPRARGGSRACASRVVASGGIMDVRARRATRACPCPKRRGGRAPAILAAREDDTRITEKFLGKRAEPLELLHPRGRGETDPAALASPAAISWPKLRTASAKAGKSDFVPLWSGQAALSCAPAELVARLEAETVGRHRPPPGPRALDAAPGPRHSRPDRVLLRRLQGLGKGCVTSLAARASSS